MGLEHDVEASSAFLAGHLGFRLDLAADGFASLTRPDTALHVVFLRRGLPVLPDGQRDRAAGGLILAFTVDDLEGELARLRAEGVAITMPLTVEEWGERAFQVTDPNGAIVQLMDWAARPGRQAPRLPGPEAPVRSAKWPGGPPCPGRVLGADRGAPRAPGGAG